MYRSGLNHKPSDQKSDLLSQENCTSRELNSCFLSILVVPHFAQNVERSVTTLARDPHGEVDEAQFIDASKLVS